MSPEVVALLQGAAATLVNLMATDAWARARERFARVLSRGAGDCDEAVLERLDTDQREVVTARAEEDTDTLTSIEFKWRAALRRSLEADPASADELRFLVKEFDAPQAQGSSNVASGSFRNSPVQGSGVQNISYGSGSVDGSPR